MLQLSYIYNYLLRMLIYLDFYIWHYVLIQKCQNQDLRLLEMWDYLSFVHSYNILITFENSYLH